MRGRLPSASRDVSQQRAPRPLLANRSGGVAPAPSPGLGLPFLLTVSGWHAGHGEHECARAPGARGGGGGGGGGADGRTTAQKEQPTHACEPWTQ